MIFGSGSCLQPYIPWDCTKKCFTVVNLFLHFVNRSLEIIDASKIRCVNEPLSSFKKRRVILIISFTFALLDDIWLWLLPSTLHSLGLHYKVFYCSKFVLTLCEQIIGNNRCSQNQMCKWNFIQFFKKTGDPNHIIHLRSPWWYLALASVFNPTFPGTAL